MLKNENNSDDLKNDNESNSDDDTKFELNRFSSVNSLSSLSNNFDDKNNIDYTKNEDNDSTKARRIKKFNARKNRKLEQQKKSKQISLDSH
jgi:hypothetical protein